MPTLYELSHELAAIMDAVEDNGGELTPELEAELDRVTGPIERKAEWIAKCVIEAESRAEARKAEADRLYKSARIASNAAEASRRYLMRCFAASRTERVETAVGVVAVRLNPPKVEIEPGTQLPAQLVRTKTTVEPDREAIKAAIKAGETIPGCSLVRTRKLVIQ